MDSYALKYKERSLRFSTLGTHHLHFSTKGIATPLKEEHDQPPVIDQQENAENKNENNPETPENKDNPSEEKSNKNENGKDASETKNENAVENSKSLIKEDVTGNNESP
jgi:outer membrane biosynthesis protein TonB